MKIKFATIAIVLCGIALVACESKPSLEDPPDQLVDRNIDDRSNRTKTDRDDDTAKQLFPILVIDERGHIEKSVDIEVHSGSSEQGEDGSIISVKTIAGVSGRIEIINRSNKELHLNDILGSAEQSATITIMNEGVSDVVIRGQIHIPRGLVYIKNSHGSIAQSTNGTLEGSNITLEAAAIGFPTNPFVIHHTGAKSNISTIGPAQVFLDVNGEGILDVRCPNGTLHLRKVDGDMLIGVVRAGNAILTTLNGSILGNDNPFEDANVHAGKIDLIAKGGSIGSSEKDLKIYGAGESYTAPFGIKPPGPGRLFIDADQGIYLTAIDGILQVLEAATTNGPVSLTVTNAGRNSSLNLLPTGTTQTGKSVTSGRISAPEAVHVFVADDISFPKGTLVESNTFIYVQGDRDNDNGSTIDIQGRVEAPEVEIAGGDKIDHIQIIGTAGINPNGTTTLVGHGASDYFYLQAIAGPTVVEGGNGVDWYYVSSDASKALFSQKGFFEESLDSLEVLQGTLENVRASLTIHPMSGRDIIWISATGETTPQEGALVEGTLTGLGMPGSIEIVPQGRWEIFLMIGLGGGSDAIQFKDVPRTIRANVRAQADDTIDGCLSFHCECTGPEICGYEAPQLKWFSASRPRITLGFPVQVNWTWAFSNDPVPSPTCEIDNDIGIVPKGHTSTIHLEQDTPYSLRCYNAAGESTMKTVIEAIPSPTIDSFSVEPNIIPPGQPTNVTWTWQSNEDNCYILNNGLGRVKSGDSTTVTLTKEKDFSLLCDNGVGSRVGAQTSITMLPKPSPHSLTMVPQIVTRGKPTDVSLTWAYETGPSGDTQCRVEPDLGIIQEGGVRTITLDNTTEFTLTCTNAAGSHSTKTAVTARPLTAPQLESFVGNDPLTANRNNQSITVRNRERQLAWRWTYSNVPHPQPDCQIDEGVGPIANREVTSITIDSDTLYTLTCSNSEGTDSKTFLVRTVPSDGAVELGVGQAHACILRGSGELYCWGSNNYGQLEFPEGKFSRLQVQYRMSCAEEQQGQNMCWGTRVGFTRGSCDIDSDDRLVCHGIDHTLSTQIWEGVNGENRFLQASVGWDHACAIRTSGEAACWGKEGLLDIPPGKFSKIIAGRNHSCGLKLDGTVACWGSRVFPRSIDDAPPGVFVDIDVEENHACALRSDGVVQCWGHLGPASSWSGKYSYSRISAGEAHSCGLTSEGEALCWGKNHLGQTDAPVETLTAISSGWNHNCGMKTDGSLICWGDDSNGQASPPLGTFSQVSTGQNHTCGITANGTVSCWGDNSSGQSSPPGETFELLQTGNHFSCGITTQGLLRYWGFDEVSRIPKIPAGTFTSISAGKWHFCAIRSGGTVACLGLPDEPAGQFKELAAGAGFTCGLRLNGSLQCWGHGDIGAVREPGPFETISAGVDHACATRADGSVVCWGSNAGRKSSAL